MTSALFADYGRIRTAGERLASGPNGLRAFSVEGDSSWLGSLAVGSALMESTRLRMARAQALADQLSVTAAGVQDAVAQLTSADSSAAQAVGG